MKLSSHFTFTLAAICFFFTGVSAIPSLASPPQTPFAFNGTMSKEVLRAYASRSVSLTNLVMNTAKPNFIFEEDLRMLRRIGAKYVCRATSFSWAGELTPAQIEAHFSGCKKYAAKVHAADPEIILEAGIFEIIYKGTANGIAIPAWVFRAFGEPVKKRNFSYEKIAFPASDSAYGPGCWGNGPNAAIPCIFNLETQMYFYYLGCRYIDAGFEGFHLGQTEVMMHRDMKRVKNAVEWDRVTTLLRAYAKTHARRGLVLFNGHMELNSPGLRVGKRLILDMQAACLVADETVKEKVKGETVYKCEVKDIKKIGWTWIGRSPGGRNPLGFDVEQNITIMEMDNNTMGPNGIGVPTFNGYHTWGYDEISWFACQPEWYRNQFLRETDAFLKKTFLDKEGKQVYFLEPMLRRTILRNPVLVYKPGRLGNMKFVKDFFGEEGTQYTINANKSVTVNVIRDYHANRMSDACPDGFNQEDTIRQILLGANVPENPELLKVRLPSAYRK